MFKSSVDLNLLTELPNRKKVCLAGMEMCLQIKKKMCNNQGLVENKSECYLVT